MGNNEIDQSKQYVVLTLGKEEYGIDIQKVQIIEKVSAITRVPQAPEFIKGVINQRGEIIPVMSLRLKFNLPQVQYTDASRIIIVKIEDDSIGIIVDSVKEVLTFSDKDIENVQNIITDYDGEYILGVGKIDQRIVTLLDLKKLIDFSI
jgi:purine-binding chemotaxis protein CheW